MEKENFRLQFITNSNDTNALTASVNAVLQGGCRWIQLRMKDASEEQIIEAAYGVKALCRRYNATFIIDDHVEIVKIVQADGVHLGLNDIPIMQARSLLGEGFIIGGTANSFENILQHYNDGADYIGCGPFKFTTTKKKLAPILGLDGYKEIIKRMGDSDIYIPVVAIGGITSEDVPSIISTGVDGVAISGAILNTPNPVEETKHIIKDIERNHL
ncbi:thiamine phosphate synthase [Phocaeicola paurosaccharolyticus]|uniref:thiamine phosphate synthase n=1 Tax=Phocaeicola paurosaccharolyticus TaxID=732242 RepID=UPI0004696C56|nr:thiamine phosphate synthase [Phocaeicola paurosaccharolyticus]